MRRPCRDKGLNPCRDKDRIKAFIPIREQALDVTCSALHCGSRDRGLGHPCMTKASPARSDESKASRNIHFCRVRAATPRSFSAWSSRPWQVPGAVSGAAQRGHVSDAQCRTRIFSNILCRCPARRRQRLCPALIPARPKSESTAEALACRGRRLLWDAASYPS